jgi:predicted MPP superfamily phosphohydrolase
VVLNDLIYKGAGVIMSENMSEITILHLSDIHFKKKEKEDNKALRQLVQQRLVEAVENHAQKNGGPDAAAVTGDIAFSGKKHEYEEAAEFFNRLQGVLPKGTEFLPVPGNHDVDRGQIKELFPLHRIVKDNEVDKFLENDRYVEDFVNVKFEAFRSFARQLNSLSYQEPADYFWVRNIEDRGISFLGLNSAWACESDDDKGNITLGFPQVTGAFGQALQSRRVMLTRPLF